MNRLQSRIVPIAFLIFTNCNNTSPDRDDVGTGDTGTSDTIKADRGPKLLPIEGDPNGLWWDDATQILYVADDNGNRILKWTDTAGFALVKDLPPVMSQGAGLGQLILTTDGTIVVTRFGFGTAGAVIYLPPLGDPTIVPGLDLERRRIGLTITDGGQLYDSWFVRLSTGDRVGAVGVLSLTGTETAVITGLQKPVGVLAMGTDLIVSDQDLGQILKAPQSDPSNYTVLAVVEQPDLLAAGPAGSIFTGSLGGNLYRITAAGAASVFQSGFQQIRGIAYDPTNHRVFVADHDSDENDGITHLLHILPAD